MRQARLLPLLCLLFVWSLGPDGALRAADPVDFAPAAAFLQKHCLSCHGADKSEAELRLDGFQSVAAALAERGKWDRVLTMVEGGLMPPEDRPHPEAAEVEAFLALVKGAFDQADRQARPDPGRVTMRRLNRVEYAHTIRDLVGVDFNPAEDFPSDDVGHGFDNIGDVLTLSPVLMERYLAAAESVMTRAILTNPPAPPRRQISSRYTEPAGRDIRFQDQHGGYREITTAATDNIRHTGPVFTRYQIPTGEYEFRTRLYATAPEGQVVKAVILACSPQPMPNAASDEQVAAIVGDAASLRPFVILDTIEIKARRPEDAQRIEVSLRDIPGLDRMAVGLLKPVPQPGPSPSDTKPAGEDQPVADQKDGEAGQKEDRPSGSGEHKLFIQNLSLNGPQDTRPQSQLNIMACRPEATPDEQLREILSRFISRAYRRPATDEDVARVMKLARTVEARGGSREAAVQFALQGVLVSPRFLFRVELDSHPEGTDIRPLDEFQLASRLSYFLWSSLPDERLSSLAAQGQLFANLEAEVQRMLADPRSAALIDNFALQWLQLTRLETVTPDEGIYPDFDERLRRAMQQETRLFLEAVIRENRSVLDLLQADFTFLNEGLARHYGIADTNGNPLGSPPVRERGESIPRREFVRVSLPPGSQRGGLLTMGSVLTVTSNPTRTSPVKRGKWVLEQLLGAPPPPPPPNVPELEAQKDKLTGSLRQRMEQHRQNPACGMCHTQMDAIGFAFENFDGTGKFRTRDGDIEIDPSGRLPGNVRFDGPAQLKEILKQRRTQFARCLTEKMLTYALGRGLENYDRPVVMRIVESLEKNDFRFAALVSEIVRSEPFRLRRGL